MKCPNAGDDQIKILEIQNAELLHENETLKFRLAKIEKSKSYLFAEALKGSDASKSNDVLSRALRVFRLGSQLLRERIRNFFFGFSLEKNDRPLSAKRARKRLKKLARLIPDLQGLLRLIDQPASSSRVKVLVMGVGGIGDVLSTVVIATAVKHLLTPCDVYLGHSLQGLGRVIERNSNISDAWTINGDYFPILQETLAALDVFDLIVDHHYCVRYILTKSVRINERLPPAHLLAASAAVRPFIAILDTWPDRNNMLGRKAQEMGLSVLDVAGKTGLLDIGAHTPISFFPRWQDYAFLDELEIRDKTYVTVHNGVDNVSIRFLITAGAKGPQPTKLLPMHIWKEVLVRLKQAGVIVVQVGERDDVPIEDVDYDLRGQTGLSSAALVIKHAACHLDTEGGLVHLARSVNTRSVVIFGPTPPELFGYPQNSNLAPPQCGDCWWVTPNWLVDCPLQTVGPICMASHSALSIANNVLKIISSRSRPKCQILAAGLFRRTSLTALQQELKFLRNSALDIDQNFDQKTPDRKTSFQSRETSDWKYSFLWSQLVATGVPMDAARTADVGPEVSVFSYALTASRSHVNSFIDTGVLSSNESIEEFERPAQGNRPERVQFGSIFNLPADDSSYELITCTEMLHRVPHKSYAIAELLRVLRPDGLLCLAFEVRASADGRENLDALSLLQLGAELEALGIDENPFTEENINESIREANAANVLGVQLGKTVGALLLRKSS